MKTSTSYKFYFILSLLGFFYSEKYEVNLNEIAIHMLVNAWEDIGIYYKSFNKIDKLPQIKKEYSTNCKISSTINRKDLNQIIESNPKIIKKYRLLSYIPYVFIQEKERNLDLNIITYRQKLKKIEEYSTIGTSLYTITPKKIIILNKGYLHSLQINKEKILNYTKNELLKYLRSKNDLF